MSDLLDPVEVLRLTMAGVLTFLLADLDDLGLLDPVEGLMAPVEGLSLVGLSFPLRRVPMCVLATISPFLRYFDHSEKRTNPPSLVSISRKSSSAFSSLSMPLRPWKARPSVAVRSRHR